MPDTDPLTAADAPVVVVRSLPLRGWLGVWIAAGLVVLTTLVAFLLGIVGDLESIDDSLAEASAAVGGSEGDVRPLPSHIADVNGTLAAIDDALKSVPGSTRDISGSLVGMRGNLEKVDGSLEVTSGSLTSTARALSTTSGSLSGTAATLSTTSPTLLDTVAVLKFLLASLSDTSTVLGNVRAVGHSILDVLRHTQSNPDALGTENIWKRADLTLGVRDATQKDTAGIVGHVTDASKHLKSICDRMPNPPEC